MSFITAPITITLTIIHVLLHNFHFPIHGSIISLLHVGIPAAINLQISISFHMADLTAHAQDPRGYVVEAVVMTTVKALHLHILWYKMLIELILFTSPFAILD